MIKLPDLAPLKTRYKAILKDELELARFKEEDGDFLFRYEGGGYALAFDDDDPAYVRLLCPGILWVSASDSEGTRQVDVAAAAITYANKCVKVFRRSNPDKDGDYAVDASIEFMVGTVDSISGEMVERQLSMLKSGALEFRNKLEKEKAEAGTSPAMGRRPVSQPLH